MNDKLAPALNVDPVPIISREELSARISAANAPLVIDVLTEEAYEAAHIPGAKNACVYNVTFLGDLAKLVSGSNQPLIVYGCGKNDCSARVAAGKLIAAGFTQVSEFRGGIDEWRNAGLPVEGGGQEGGAPNPVDGVHKINAERSRIEWTGSNLLSAHHGTLKLQNGEIELRGGRPIRAAFTIDMDSIDNSDIADPEMREVLISHLKSDDFFDVEKHPTGRFELSKITEIPNAALGTPNCEVSGVLTLKDVTKEIAFPAILAVSPEGTLAADAHIRFDRTQWNVVYGSGKWFQKLGKHLVNDMVTLVLKLTTVPKK